MRGRDPLSTALVNGHNVRLGCSEGKRPRPVTCRWRFAVAFPTEVVMLPSLSGVLRLALVVSIGTGAVAWEGHTRVAYADDDDDEGGDDGGADDGGDDGGGDDGGGE